MHNVSMPVCCLHYFEPEPTNRRVCGWHITTALTGMVPIRLLPARFMTRRFVSVEN